MSHRVRVGFLLILAWVLVLPAHASAQGGWRQWQIRFLDGTSVEASPLQMRADGKFTRSMDANEPGFDRAKIDYVAAVVRTRSDSEGAVFPPTPTGAFKQDLIVFLDGKRSLGKVTFKSLKFSEGTIIQNGKKMGLENVAYIKFAHSQPKSQMTTPPRRN